MCLLQCKHVSFSYEGRPAVADLPFEVHEGDYLAIVGENGAGKSTLVTWGCGHFLGPFTNQCPLQIKQL